jgi:hypothetical protein
MIAPGFEFLGYFGNGSKLLIRVWGSQWTGASPFFKDLPEQRERLRLLRFVEVNGLSGFRYR